MMRGIFLIALLAFLPGLASSAPSQPTASYDIEVVVIENNLPDLVAGEAWRKEDLKKLLADIASATDAAQAEGDKPLTTAVNALRKNGSHKVLGHYRWTQAAGPRAETRPVRLLSDQAALDGVMRFYLSRFLHVELDLVLASGGNWREENFEGEIVRLNEHRRIKTQETHYFDHPRLGVLVRVTQPESP